MLPTMKRLEQLLICSTFYYAQSLSSPFLYGDTTRNVASQILQGTGPPGVDLNQYNLPLREIEEQWTANSVQRANESKVRVKLEPKDNVRNYADTITVTFPRIEENGGGLGIVLAELAGGRNDGIGITIVSGLVEGGSAGNSDLIPGDSIASISLIRRKRQERMGNNAISEKEEEWNVPTECLAYDETVKAIQTLPVIKQGFQDVFVLKVKRLRRRPKVSIRLQYPPGQNENDTKIEMYAGENLRQVRLHKRLFTGISA